ncbi:gastrula zinc finger protein XlCGF8.2DB-like isoform X3 [Melanotaenia boesemani]|uniref:gastrula zinc finger protein XlCGF8.2DB-like isoform X3 n=1 Tax=Melanotaenia boesemani TaxID=1250792 RepID=UPI001C04D08D|nr:gastrula zinc finger protein XlCGF8.2DB-like isoform X3 [Melanotaenia boesemani]
MAQSGWRAVDDGMVESVTSLPMMMMSTLKSEDDDDDDKELQPWSSSLHLYQTKTEGNTEEETPTTNPAKLIKSETDEEDCGGLEMTSNPDPNIYLQPNSDRKASDSSEIEHLSHEMEDNVKSWNDNKAHGSGVNSDVESNTAKKSLSCSECGEEFDDQRSLQKHLTKRSLSCLNRKKCFRVTQNVNMQKRVHTKEKGVHCEVCGKIFTHTKNLRIHMRIHTVEKPFSCDECGQRFSEKTSLTQHMRVHKGDKPFSCDECGQRFSQKAHLNRHMRIHTGDKPFICDECGHRFSQKTTLHRHMRIHTGDKPFICDACGHSFSQKTTLHRHMRIHTGDKPFTCDECGQRFSLKTSLNRHTRIHTGDRPVAYSLSQEGTDGTHPKNCFLIFY